MNLLTDQTAKDRPHSTILPPFCATAACSVQLVKAGLISPTAQLCPQEPITQSLSVINEQRQAQSVQSVSGIHLHYNEVEVLTSSAACIGGLRGWGVSCQHLHWRIAPWCSPSCTLLVSFSERLSCPAPNMKALQSLRAEGNTRLQVGDERPMPLSVYHQENFTTPSL